MTKSTDPRLADESKPEEIRRRARELAEDLPQLAKIALEAMILARNEGRDIRNEGPEILREAAKWCKPLEACGTIQGRV